MNTGKNKCKKPEYILEQAVLSLKTVEEVQALLEDLCTVSELKSMAQRMHIAHLLDAEATYIDIADQTGSSTATISRVNRCLRYGAGGYRIVLDRIKQGGSDE